MQIGTQSWPPAMAIGPMRGYVIKKKKKKKEYAKLGEKADFDDSGSLKPEERPPHFKGTL